MKIIAIFATMMLPIAACAAEPIKVIPPAQQILKSENGRFVFGQISDWRRDQYMLDTQTGRLWKIVSRNYKNPDGTDVPGDGYVVLDIVPYLDLENKPTVFPK